MRAGRHAASGHDLAIMASTACRYTSDEGRNLLLTTVGASRILRHGLTQSFRIVDQSHVDGARFFRRSVNKVGPPSLSSKGAVHDVGRYYFDLPRLRSGL